MQMLEKRIATLEQASPSENTVNTILIVPMLKKGKAVLESIQDNHGNTWNRRPHETQEAFEARASTETPRKKNQVVMLIGKVSQVEESSP